MLWRHSLRLRPRLNHLNSPPLRSSIVLDPPIRCRPAAAGPRASRSRALLSSSTGWSQQTATRWSEDVDNFHAVHVPRETSPTPLDELLRAIQRRDIPHILPAFLDWTSVFTHQDAAIVDAAIEELASLSPATFSEILRWIDPIANPDQDIARGRILSHGHTQFTTANHLVNQFGVRVQNCSLLKAAQDLVYARLDAGQTLLMSDYEVLFRCAGAASDIKAANDFFKIIAKEGAGSRRHTKTWVEYIKARFLTEPAYYQWDRTRVAVTPRQTYSNRRKYAPKDLWLMERLRLSLSASLPQPWNRVPDAVQKDLRMWLRKKKGFHSYRQHWTRSKLYGTLLNEELLCASMVAFARSSSLNSIRGVVLKRGFRIQFVEKPDTGEIVIVGGKRFREGSPREPTVRLLDAIVESFGTMSRIPLALNLLVYVSNLYKIPIPHETWSNLLGWAYVSAANPYQRITEPEAAHTHKSHLPASNHVIEIFELMTSEPYNVKPTIDDYSCYIKALIKKRKLRAALDIVRNKVLPLYHDLESQHRDIVAGEVLQGLTEPSQDRLRIETTKEYAWYTITTWFHQLLRVTSQGKRQRNGQFMQVVLPNIILEFSDFFHESISYRTAQGRVKIHRPGVINRHEMYRRMRTTQRQTLGSMVVRKIAEKEKIDPADSDLKWPEATQFRVLEWKRRPKPRVRPEGAAPEAGDVKSRDWWRKLEEEVMT